MTPTSMMLNSLYMIQYPEVYIATMICAVVQGPCSLVDSNMSLSTHTTKVCMTLIV